MEDPLCNSSFGSMVSLDYVTPDKNDERGRPARQDDGEQDNDSNRAFQSNLPGRLQGCGCGNESHEYQTRHGQGREGRARGTMISKTSAVHSIASFIGSTALSPNSPTESRSLAVREDIGINPLTPEVLQRIRRPFWAWRAIKLRCDARKPLKHFKTHS